MPAAKPSRHKHPSPPSPTTSSASAHSPASSPLPSTPTVATNPSIDGLLLVLQRARLLPSSTASTDLHEFLTTNNLHAATSLGAHCLTALLPLMDLDWFELGKLLAARQRERVKKEFWQGVRKRLVEGGVKQAEGKDFRIVARWTEEVIGVKGDGQVDVVATMALEAVKEKGIGEMPTEGAAKMQRVKKRDRMEVDAVLARYKKKGQQRGASAAKENQEEALAKAHGRKYAEKRRVRKLKAKGMAVGSASFSEEAEALPPPGGPAEGRECRADTEEDTEKESAKEVEGEEVEGEEVEGVDEVVEGPSGRPGCSRWRTRSGSREQTTMAPEPYKKQEEKTRDPREAGESETDTTNDTGHDREKAEDGEIAHAKEPVLARKTRAKRWRKESVETEASSTAADGHSQLNGIIEESMNATPPESPSELSKERSEDVGRVDSPSVDEARDSREGFIVDLSLTGDPSEPPRRKKLTKRKRTSSADEPEPSTSATAEPPETPPPPPPPPSTQPAPSSFPEATPPESTKPKKRKAHKKKHRHMSPAEPDLDDDGGDEGTPSWVTIQKPSSGRVAASPAPTTPQPSPILATPASTAKSGKTVTFASPPAEAAEPRSRRKRERKSGGGGGEESGDNARKRQKWDLQLAMKKGVVDDELYLRLMGTLQ